MHGIVLVCNVHGSDVTKTQFELDSDQTSYWLCNVDLIFAEWCATLYWFEHCVWHWETPTYCHNNLIDTNQCIAFRLDKINAQKVAFAFTFDKFCKIKFAYDKSRLWPVSSYHRFVDAAVLSVVAGTELVRYGRCNVVLMLAVRKWRANLAVFARQKTQSRR